MFFIVFNLVLLILVVILLLLLSAVWPPDSPWAPWWQMPKDVIEEMCKLARISSKDIIYDLGCGTGWALIYANKTYAAKGIGIEIDPLRYVVAKFNVWKEKTTNITILKKNFFEVNLSNTTIIFVYLIPKTLKLLTPKFLKELKPGTKFITYVYPMPVEQFKNKLKLTKQDKDKKIYIYELS